MSVVQTISNVSATIGAVGNVVNAVGGLVGAVGNLAGYIADPTGDSSGAIISDQSVSIADIVLEDWEIPERVSWGGQQRMTVHKMVGGVRQIDVMGPDNAEVSWHGRFLSPDAAYRADQIDIMRKNGYPLDLMFAGRYYQAVIADFQATQRTQYLIEYAISFTILQDESGVLPPPDPPLVVAVLSDIMAIGVMPFVAPALIIAQAAGVNITPALQAISAVGSVVGAVGNVVGAVGNVAGAVGAVGAAVSAGDVVGSIVTVGATINAVSGVVGSMANTIGAVQAAADGQINAIVPLGVQTGTLAGSGTVVGAINGMNAAANATYALASSVAMAGYTARAAINLAQMV